MNRMNLKGYLIIIFISSLIGSLFTSLYYDVSYFYVFDVMWLGIVLVIILDALVATFCRMLPKKMANFESKIYLVNKKEKNFYEKIRIKKWKEKIPEIGHFTGFRKNKIKEPKNKEYVERFLREISYGELGHFFSIFIGVVLVLIPIFKPIWISICIVVIFVNAFLNLLPIFVLRYNSFTLLLLYKHLLRKESN